MDQYITIGEKYGRAMKITDQGEADRYFDECVLHSMSFGKTRAEAEEIERSNLAYYAGYFGDETRERVERLFRCKHPIFGPIADVGQPTAEAALQVGVGLAVGLAVVTICTGKES